MLMVVKVVSDTADPGDPVPTHLVFCAYPRINEMDSPAKGVFERPKAIKPAMKEVKKCYAKRQVHEALCLPYGPKTD